MANIKVISERPLFDGMAITFNAPCKCSEIEGLTVSYSDNSWHGTFRDSHGNDLTGLGNLFEEGAYVRVILDIQNGYAYLQNADTNAYLEGRFTELQKAKAGFIYPLAGEVVPTGFLLCDGAAYSRTEYLELFEVIGTLYGEGDGSTTFNVPNLSTRVPVGAGDGYNIGDTGGEAEHTLTLKEMPKHNHTINRFVGGDQEVWQCYGIDATSHGTDVTGQIPGGQVMDTMGGDQPHNNMQPYTVVNYIIATGKETGVSIVDIVSGAQAIPLGIEYGGTGATDKSQARKNLGVSEAIESSDHAGCYYRLVDGVPEWLNPPMMPNVVYRTTERYRGKPVYVKEMSLGTFADSAEKISIEHGEGSDITPIRCEGVGISPTAGQLTLPFTFENPNSEGTICFISIYAAGGSIFCYMNNMGMDGVEIRATMWFTRA